MFEAILTNEFVAQGYLYFLNYNLKTGQVTLNNEESKKL
jgi:hypothetical protein